MANQLKIFHSVKCINFGNNMTDNFLSYK